MAVVQTCRLQRNKLSSAEKKSPVGGFFMGAMNLIFEWLILQFVDLNPSSAIEPLLPIGLAHVIYPNGFARSGRVNEFTVTHINTDMAEGSF